MTPISEAEPALREADLQPTVRLAAEFADLDAGGRLRLAAERFRGELLATTSFGAQSAVLLHLLATHAPDIPVVCVDTGYFFPETYQYADQLQRELGIKVAFYTSPVTPARMENTEGRLWERGTEGIERYGFLRKVEPLNRALREHGARAWISGLRRTQSSDRGKRSFAERQKATTKLYPILDWSDAMVEDYFERHELPRHPLVDRGFASIGDWHSSRPVEKGASVESTRNNGLRRECGLHLESSDADFQI